MSQRKIENNLREVLKNFLPALISNEPVDKKQIIKIINTSNNVLKDLSEYVKKRQTDVTFGSKYWSEHFMPDLPDLSDEEQGGGGKRLGRRSCMGRPRKIGRPKKINKTKSKKKKCVRRSLKNRV